MALIETINAQYNLVLARTAEIEVLWPLCAPWLQKGFDEDAGTEFDLNVLHTEIKAEIFQLWAVISRQQEIVASIITRLTRYQTEKVVCEILLMGGRDFKEYGAAGMESINEWAKDQGAYSSRILCRPGFSKVLKGYETKHIVMQKIL